jgi:uncharacterized protein (DUF2062 family)
MDSPKVRDAFSISEAEPARGPDNSSWLRCSFHRSGVPIVRIFILIRVVAAAPAALAVGAFVSAVPIADAEVAAAIAIEFACVVTGIAIELTHGAPRLPGGIEQQLHELF